MKTFSIITEADARLLDRGSTVTLGPAGTSRRSPTTRCESAASPCSAPPSTMTFGSWRPPPRSGASPLAPTIRASPSRTTCAPGCASGLTVTDVGTDGPAAVDYPDIAAGVARLVARGEADAGIVIDGAGLGSAIAANKIDGIRAAMCPTRTLARYAREHNGAHVLALRASLLSHDEAEGIVETFLATPCVEPRYLRRLGKVRQLERTQ